MGRNGLRLVISCPKFGYLTACNIGDVLIDQRSVFWTFHLQHCSTNDNAVSSWRRIKSAYVDKFHFVAYGFHVTSLLHDAYMEPYDFFLKRLIFQKHIYIYTGVCVLNNAFMNCLFSDMTNIIYPQKLIYVRRIMCRQLRNGVWCGIHLTNISCCSPSITHISLTSNKSGIFDSEIYQARAVV